MFESLVISFFLLFRSLHRIPNALLTRWLNAVCEETSEEAPIAKHNEGSG